MKISKLSSVLCALAVGAVGLTVRAEDNPAQAAARIALAKQLFEASAAPATNAQAAKVVSSQETTAPAKATAAKAKPQTVQAKAKQEKPEKPANAAPAGPTAAAPKPASTTANPTYPGGDLGLKQIPPPPLPISASKADRLAALLDKYKADQISPEEYHQQRAAILAEP
jgi:hypothetical protein